MCPVSECAFSGSSLPGNHWFLISHLITRNVVVYFSAKEIGSVSAAADIDAEFPVSSEDETVPEEENVPFQTYSECDPLALELRQACLPTPPRRKRASRAASTAPDPNPTTPPRRSRRIQAASTAPDPNPTTPPRRSAPDPDPNPTTPPRRSAPDPDPNPTTPPRRSAPDPPAASPSSPVRI